jgi:hypothetical protein
MNRNTAQDPYIKACKTLGVAPVSYIINNINSSELIMKHHGIGALGAQCLAQVLDVFMSSFTD